jgi:hypothetical protein
MVARVLIAQDPDHSAATKEPDRLLEPFAAVEELDTKPSPLLPHELIEMTIAQFLINGAKPCVRKVPGQDLGKELPVAEVTENKYHWPARTQLAMDPVGPLSRDERRRFLQWHGIQFHPAEEIGAEALKMTAYDPAFLHSGLLRTEGNFYIPPGESPISRL